MIFPKVSFSDLFFILDYLKVYYPQKRYVEKQIFTKKNMMSDILKFGIKKGHRSVNLSLKHRKSVIYNLYVVFGSNVSIYMSAIYTEIIVLSLSYWGLGFSFVKS